MESSIIFFTCSPAPNSPALTFRQSRKKWAGVDSTDTPVKPLQSNQLESMAENTDVSSGTEYGTGQNNTLSPDLAEIVRVWPGLPDKIKKQILTLAAKSRLL